MSRWYKMGIVIEKFETRKKSDIIEAASEEWPGFEDDWSEYNGKLSSSGEGNLTAGETENEFAKRVARAIWKACGSFCEIRIDATCLEDLPCEFYTLTKEDYEKAKEQEE